MTTNKTIPELCVDAQVLIAHLRKKEKGEFTPYAELNALISGNVQKDHRAVLDRAKHRLLRDDKIVIEAVHGKGVKRIEDADSVGIGSAAMRKVRRLSRRAIEKMLAVDWSNLTNEQKIQNNGRLSILGTMDAFTQAPKVKLVMDAVEKAQDKLPLNKTLDAFRA